jgi:hypothetical protein
MTLDILTRLSGTTGSSAAGQSIAAATAAAPVYSTNWIDLDAAGSLRTKRDLRDMFALVWPTTTVDSATNTATLDIELVMCPTTAPATPTLAAFNATSDVDDTTDTITSTAHGLIDNTRVTVAVTSGLILTGLAVSTNYYIRDATTNTFKLAATPGGAAINVTDAVGTNTITWYPEVVGAASKVPLERLIANRTQVQICINPLLLDQRVQPVHRYLFARYVPTANLTAGVVFCDLQRGAPMSNHPVNPSNYVTP